MPPYSPDGQNCVYYPPTSYTQYLCQSNGNRAANGYCRAYNYNGTPDNYGTNSTACLNDPNVPDNNTCRDPVIVSCGAAYHSCNNASPTNGVDNYACGTSKTWTCGTVSCRIDNAACVTINGKCDTSQVGGCIDGTQV